MASMLFDSSIPAFHSETEDKLSNPFLEDFNIDDYCFDIPGNILASPRVSRPSLDSYDGPATEVAAALASMPNMDTSDDDSIYLENYILDSYLTDDTASDILIDDNIFHGVPDRSNVPFQGANNVFDTSSQDVSTSHFLKPGPSPLLSSVNTSLPSTNMQSFKTEQTGFAMPYENPITKTALLRPKSERRERSLAVLEEPVNTRTSDKPKRTYRKRSQKLGPPIEKRKRSGRIATCKKIKLEDAAKVQEELLKSIEIVRMDHNYDEKTDRNHQPQCRTAHQQIEVISPAQKRIKQEIEIDNYPVSQETFYAKTKKTFPKPKDAARKRVHNETERIRRNELTRNFHALKNLISDKYFCKDSNNISKKSHASRKEIVLAAQRCLREKHAELNSLMMEMGLDAVCDDIPDPFQSGNMELLITKYSPDFQISPGKKKRR